MITTEQYLHLHLSSLLVPASRAHFISRTCVAFQQTALLDRYVDDIFTDGRQSQPSAPFVLLSQSSLRACMHSCTCMLLTRAEAKGCGRGRPGGAATIGTCLTCLQPIIYSCNMPDCCFILSCSGIPRRKQPTLCGTLHPWPHHTSLRHKAHFAHIQGGDDHLLRCHRPLLV